MKAMGRRSVTPLHHNRAAEGAESPKSIAERIRAEGFRGQEAGLKALSVIGYRHWRKSQRMLEGQRAGGRENVLALGPTGVGKSFGGECLARVIGVPSVTIDLTTFSETGYEGCSVDSIPGRLIDAADGDLQAASCGIIILDELDKLAAGKSTATFSGEGSTKDVSGHGTQKGLLALLSQCEYSYAANRGYGASRRQADLSGVTILACGAFSGLRTTADSIDADPSIGFGADSTCPTRESIAVSYGTDLLENTVAFQRYGMMPELMGRFTSIVSFQPLGPLVLRQILDLNVVCEHTQEFADEGHELLIDEAVLNKVVTGALKLETGARGLKLSLSSILKDAEFECFGQSPRVIRLSVGSGDEIRMEVSHAA